MAPLDGSQDSGGLTERHSQPKDPKQTPMAAPVIEMQKRRAPMGENDDEKPSRFSRVGAFLGRVCIRIRNHLRGFIWLSIFVAACMALFWERFAYYLKQPSHEIVGPCVAISKGCAQLTKFTMLLLLLPVSRFFVTMGRSRLKWFFPVDELITFHRILGITFATAGIIHGVLFMSCTWPKEMHADPEKFRRVFPGKSQKIYYREYFTWTAISGFIIIGIIMIGYPLASSALRKGMWKLPKFLQHMVGFNAFFYTHLFLLSSFGLAIWHGTHDAHFGHKPTNDTWIWILPGFAVWFIDWCIRLYRTMDYRYKYEVGVLKAVPFFGGVIALKILKPDNFKYKAGQYVLLQCPEIAKFEWHPFTISSAPEDPFLSVHIKVNGDWTEAVYETMKQRLEDALKSAAAKSDSAHVSIRVAPHSPDDMTYADLPRGMELPMAGNRLPGASSAPRTAGDMPGGVYLRPVFPRLRLDGPFGSPAQDFYKYKVVVLIGTGIGLTPYASILRELLHHIKTRDDVALDQRVAKRLSHVHKVYLHWTTRDQRTFEWLTQHVADFDLQGESSDVLDVHIHNTDKEQKDGASSAAAAAVAAAQPPRAKKTWFASRTLSRNTTRRMPFAQELRASMGRNRAHAAARAAVIQTSPDGLEAGDDGDVKMEPFPIDRSDGALDDIAEEFETGAEDDVNKNDVTMEEIAIDGPVKKKFKKSYSKMNKEGLADMGGGAAAVGDAENAGTFSISSFSRLESVARLNVVQEATEVQIATHKGRPDFDYILEQTKAAHPDTKIGVFFCGAPTIGSILRELCIKHSVGGTTSFDFREELF